LFTDQDGRPLNLRLTSIVSIFCAEFIWISVRLEIKRNNPRAGHDPDSLIGLTGEAYTDVHEFGSVRAVGEIWQANSEEFIPAGSTVRIVRQIGLILTVKKVEKLTK
jgi:membrane-bound serine protease (ClpP class)